MESGDILTHYEIEYIIELINMIDIKEYGSKEFLIYETVKISIGGFNRMK